MGMDRLNKVPSPCLLDTSIRPPMASVICLVRARPMPVPASLCASDWKKGSNMRGRSSGLMPHPVSSTLILMLLPATRLRMLIRPPWEVNFNAL